MVPIAEFVAGQKVAGHRKKPATRESGARAELVARRVVALRREDLNILTCRSNSEVAEPRITG